MTPITHKEAASQLNVKIVTIKMAASRGVLTRIPTVSKVQYVSKEQVALFKGKRLSLDALTAEEKQIWKVEKEKINNKDVLLPQDQTKGTLAEGQQEKHVTLMLAPEASMVLAQAILKGALDPGLVRRCL